MGNLKEKAELLNQNPSVGNVIGVIEELAIAIDELSLSKTPKDKKCSAVKSVGKKKNK